MIERLCLALDAISNWLGRSLAWLTLCMVIATTLVVVLRYAFDMGAIALQESITYMHGLVFMLGISYALKQDGHVRVDVIYARLNQRHKALVNLFGHVVFLLPLGLTVLISSAQFVINSWRVLEGSSEVGGIPAVFLLKSLIPLMALLLLLQGVSEFLKSLQALRQPPSAAAPTSESG